LCGMDASDWLKSPGERLKRGLNGLFGCMKKARPLSTP